MAMLPTVLYPVRVPPIIRKDLGFVAVYRKEAASSSVDFTTGLTTDDYGIIFTVGAIYAGHVFRRTLKTNVSFEADEMFCIVRGTLMLQDKILIDLVRYDVVDVFQVEDGWTYAKVVHVKDTDLLLPETVSFANLVDATPRVTVAIDWLIRRIPAPVDENDVVWPIVGSDLSKSLNYLYPLSGVAEVGDRVEYVESGRNSGYVLIDESKQLAKDLNANENHQDYLDGFNYILGRL